MITDCAGLVYFSSWRCFNRKYSIGREAHLDSCTHELICTPKLLKSGTGLKASFMSYLTKGIQVQIAGRIDGKEISRVEWS